MKSHWSNLFAGSVVVLLWGTVQTELFAGTPAQEEEGPHPIQSGFSLATSSGFGLSGGEDSRELSLNGHSFNAESSLPYEEGLEAWLLNSGGYWPDSSAVPSSSSRSAEPDAFRAEDLLLQQVDSNGGDERRTTVMHDGSPQQVRSWTWRRRARPSGHEDGAANQRQRDRR